IALEQRALFFTSKLSYAASSEHGGSVSLFGNPGVRDELVDQFAVGPDSAMMVERSQGTVAATGSWTSRLFDRRTELHASAGYLAGWDLQQPKLAAGGEQSFRFAVPRSLEDFAQFEDLPAACRDGGASDPYPTIVNCPVMNYQVGGIDLYTRDHTRRVTAALSGSHLLDLGRGGTHLLAGGADVADNAADSTRRFSGGTRWWLMDLGGGFEAPTRWHLVQPDSQGQVACGTDWDGDGVGDTTCAYDPDGFTANTRTRDIGLYLQDTYRPVAELSIEVGARFDRQALGSADEIAGQRDPITLERVRGDALVLNDFSPRVGVIYDWTGEGRSRLFTHWGRYYEAIPLDLNSRGFSGEVIDIAILDQTGALTGSAGCGDPMQPASYDCDPAGTLGGVQIGGNRLVAPGTRSQHMDEIVLGVEVEVVRDLKLGLVAIDRELGRALEDVSPDNGTTFVVGNPGEVDEAAVRDLRARAMATDDPAEAERLRFLAGAYEAVGGFDRPRRTYRALELSAVKYFSQGFMVRASYTFSRLRGNYPGLFSPDTDQLDPNFTSMYDLPELMANRYGALPGDRPHAFKAEGYYHLGLGERDAVVLGARARGASGRPSSALGSHASYGVGETFLLPRAAGERAPFQSALDLHAAYDRQLGRGMALEGFVNVFNALDQQPATRLDEIYTFGVVRPVVGGDAEDLRHAKQSGGENRTLAVNPNYGNPIDSQLPLSVQLGARLTF
ncbi:MAG TPA: TonB-dependent receptor, partial [Kofleriaceae bacterium]|nr:TonB-dependent receptor [Kofleriaceae bacterium]